MIVRLGDVCKCESSNIALKDIESNQGTYPIYGASGFIKNVDFYKQQSPYVAVVKDGAGVGRVMILPARSSVIGTMQYIIPNNDIDVNYLAYAMENMNLAKYYTGSTIPHIYFNDYQNEKFDLPSINEQLYRSSVLNKIKNLIYLRKQQLFKMDGLVKSRFAEMFGDPEFNNHGLPTVYLSEVCSVGSSKRIYQNEQSSYGVPFLRISDLVYKIDTGILNAELHIPGEKYAELKKYNLVPKPGDILVTSRGTLGKCYIVKDTDEFYFQDGMISWLSDLSDDITPLYITYLFSMEGFKKQIDKLQVGSTVAYLSLAMLKRLKIMLPTIELQHQFASFVEQIDKSKIEIQKSLKKLEMLKKALMQEYFSGSVS